MARIGKINKCFQCRLWDLEMQQNVIQLEVFSVESRKDAYCEYGTTMLVTRNVLKETLWYRHHPVFAHFIRNGDNRQV